MNYLPTPMLRELHNFFALQKEVAIYLRKNNAVTDQQGDTTRIPTYNEGEFRPFFLGNTYVVQELSSGIVFVYKPSGKDSGNWYMADLDEDTPLTTLVDNVTQHPDAHIAQIDNQVVTRATDEAHYLHSIHVQVQEEIQAS